MTLLLVWKHRGQHRAAENGRGAEDRCQDVSHRRTCSSRRRCPCEAGRGRAARVPAPHPLGECRPRRLSRTDQPFRRRRQCTRGTARCLAPRRARQADPHLSRDQAEEELAAARACGAEPIFTIEPKYPAALAALEAPPPMLYIKGRTELLNRPAVAIVGSRESSAAGAKLARHFATGLGERVM